MFYLRRTKITIIVPHRLVVFGRALVKVDQPVAAVELLPVSTERRPKSTKT